MLIDALRTRLASLGVPTNLDVLMESSQRPRALPQSSKETLGCGDSSNRRGSNGWRSIHQQQLGSYTTSGRTELVSAVAGEAEVPEDVTAQDSAATASATTCAPTVCALAGWLAARTPRALPPQAFRVAATTPPTFATTSLAHERGLHNIPRLKSCSHEGHTSTAEGAVAFVPPARSKHFFGAQSIHRADAASAPAGTSATAKAATVARAADAAAADQWLQQWLQRSNKHGALSASSTSSRAPSKAESEVEQPSQEQQLHVRWSQQSNTSCSSVPVNSYCLLTSPRSLLPHALLRRSPRQLPLPISEQQQHH
ncbi:hypothetical protein cyc_03257 [Cyclospora cayetanensis]|uniref:Uncharacterized protein n=1 Tax=Cyclospora cayetanensis TaxID=88456 RepID=A0A1D3D7H9_9EIME|nr:hypothetical protein cyc_03257 [Cyclospora cayetanensis]